MKKKYFAYCLSGIVLLLVSSCSGLKDVSLQDDFIRMMIESYNVTLKRDYKFDLCHDFESRSYEYHPYRKGDRDRSIERRIKKNIGIGEIV